MAPAQGLRTKSSDRTADGLQGPVFEDGVRSLEDLLRPARALRIRLVAPGPSRWGGRLTRG